MRYHLLLWLCVTGLFAGIVSAQDANSNACPSPFADEIANASMMTVNQFSISADDLAERVQFERAYNAIKLELEVAQIEARAQSEEVDPAELIADNPQVQQITAERDDPMVLGNRVLSDLAGDAVVWAYAEENGLRVSQAQFDATLDTFLELNNETSTDERERVIDAFSQPLLNAGTPPSQITTFFCRQAVYEQVQDAVLDNPDETLYVNADHILVRSEAVAQDILNLLEAGDAFATLAQELSLDVASAERGGALGWQPAIFYIDDFARAVRTAEIGLLSEPVETDFGWHVIRINGREMRQIEGELRELVLSTRFGRWRTEQIEEAEIRINPDWQNALPG
ncbi:MAG: peptidylprolyl isomerase [Anaerolineae bacterium]